LIIECPYFESKIDCEEKGKAHYSDDYSPPIRLVLLQCRICNYPLLGKVKVWQVDSDLWEFGNYASRLWPDPETEVDNAIPEIARNSLIEAEVCFKARAYSACAVMCGRAIEGVCKHHDSNIKNLADGLQKLRNDGVIDERIFNWGEALRKNRNLSAHATTERLSEEDARDLLDFSFAICNYVFVLKEKFDRFQKRQADAASEG